MRCTVFDGLSRAAYRREHHWLKAEASVNEARLRQRSFLDEGLYEPLPKKIEDQALALLVQLLLAVVPAIEEGSRDEQNQR
jgi:hypothetical protein